MTMHTMKAILLGVVITSILNVLRDQCNVYTPPRSVQLNGLSVKFTIPPTNMSASQSPESSRVQKSIDMPVPVMVLVGTRVEYYTKVIQAVIQANDQPNRIVFLVGVNLTIKASLEIPPGNASIRFELQPLPVPVIRDKPMALKHTWYAAMHALWDSPLLKEYDGNVVFLEDDVVPSPDFFVALDFACHSRSKTSIIQVVSMGGWGGKNQVNAEPNTFTMKVSSAFPTMGYAFDRGLWREIAALEPTVLSDWVKTDWAESLALALCNQAISRHYPVELVSFHRCNHIHIIQPTLSRVWHIGVFSQVGSHHESNAYQWPTHPSPCSVNRVVSSLPGRARGRLVAGQGTWPRASNGLGTEAMGGG
jgi:hypothetical protein